MSVPAIEARIRRPRGLSFRAAEARACGEGSYCITGFSAEEVLGVVERGVDADGCD